jgi:hypothetical protein
VPTQAKREAQEALFNAIRDQAENNMHAAMRPSEKAQLLRSLAEAYRLAAGGSMPIPAGDKEKAGDEAAGNGRPAR